MREQLAKQQQPQEKGGKGAFPGKGAYTKGGPYTQGKGAKGGKAGPQPPQPLAWVDQLSKISSVPLTQVHRPVLDLKHRFPYLSMSHDLTHAQVHFAELGSGSRVPLSPPVETINLDYNKHVLVPEGEVLPKKAEASDAKKKFRVRVALMTGKLLERPTHPINKYQFVIHKAGDAADVLPEADWIQELDGDEPTELTTQKNTAVRCIKDLYGFDLSACIFHRFMDLHYETYDGTQIQSTVLLPEVWKCPELPASIGKQVREIEEEFTKVVSYQHELTPEEIEEEKKDYFKQIEKERAQGQAVRPGEREMDRAERLEKLEEKLKQMEKNPPEVKPTKQVEKQEKDKRTVVKDISRPVFVSLLNLIGLRQGDFSHPSFTGVFETKLFALCFDEMIKVECSTHIVSWLKDYAVRWESEEEVRVAKKKRVREEAEVRTKVLQERAAKRQKREQAQKEAADAKKKEEEEKKAKEEEEKNEEKEANETEKTEEAKEETKEEGKEETKEETKEEEKKEEVKEEKKEEVKEEKKDEDEAMKEEEQEEEIPMPEFKLTKFNYTLDEDMVKPFLYFDTSTNNPSGSMSRADLIRALHCTGLYCQREAQELLKITQRDPLGGDRQQMGAMFYYKQACSIQSEVEIKKEVPKPESAQVKAEDGENAPKTEENGKPEENDTQPMEE
jgi:hypothetical protein